MKKDDNLENNNENETLNKDKRIKNNKFFTILEIIIFGLVCVFSILKIISTPFSVEQHIFSIIAFVLLELWLITVFVKIVLTTKSVKQKWLACFAYIVNAIILLIIFLIANKDISIAILFVYNIVFAVFYMVDFARYKTQYKTGKLYNKTLICPSLFAFIFCIANTFNHTYIKTGNLYLYALIPMGISMIVFSILSLTTLKETYKKYFKKVWAKIGIVLAALICSYVVGVVSIDTINCAAKGEPRHLDCVIVDKQSRHYNKGLDHYNLYVIINDKQYSIEVSTIIYRSKEIGDTLKVDVYKGGLNLDYYECAE